MFNPTSKITGDPRGMIEVGLNMLALILSYRVGLKPTR
jgi:hypothetical protein